MLLDEDAAAEDEDDDVVDAGAAADTAGRGAAASVEQVHLIEGSESEPPTEVAIGAPFGPG